MIDFDDKDLAIICLTILAIAALYFGKADGLAITTNIVCAIAGVVTGNLTKKGG